MRIVQSITILYSLFCTSAIFYNYPRLSKIKIAKSLPSSSICACSVSLSGQIGSLMLFGLQHLAFLWYWLHVGAGDGGLVRSVVAPCTSSRPECISESTLSNMLLASVGRVRGLFRLHMRKRSKKGGL